MQWRQWLNSCISILTMKLIPNNNRENTLIIEATIQLTFLSLEALFSLILGSAVSAGRKPSKSMLVINFNKQISKI